MKKQVIHRKERIVTKKDKLSIATTIKQKFDKLSLKDIEIIIENIQKTIEILKRIGIGALEFIKIVRAIYKEINKLRKPTSKKISLKK
jgi:adenylate cyclase class IV